jgi:hypothetical protein
MKTAKPFQSIAVTALLLTASSALAKPPGVSYAGGDGSSLEKAVIVKAATEKTGVDAEYDYIAKHYPGYKRGPQSLQNIKGRAYDVIEFTTAKGEKKTIYFDITAFFGK